MSIRNSSSFLRYLYFLNEAARVKLQAVSRVSSFESSVKRWAKCQNVRHAKHLINNKFSKYAYCNLTCRGPCIVIFSYNGRQQDALYLNFILINNSLTRLWCHRVCCLGCVVHMPIGVHFVLCIKCVPDIFILNSGLFCQYMTFGIYYT
jgi:hypothetical protein